MVKLTQKFVGRNLAIVSISFLSALPEPAEPAKPCRRNFYSINKTQTEGYCYGVFLCKQSNKPHLAVGRLD
ncbi:hypothetical protein QBC42DRAFT_260645 [Cladorrhinum samala]|uniref:Secreted protein n=1 Tax=Cladorrhinum samala TaxID=585594 RepID=A0AAV9I0F9_9PEZI|nr:hypothetical protein QBC42DRAFT_260645 [Cladorrhinum samala]